MESKINLILNVIFVIGMIRIYLMASHASGMHGEDVFFCASCERRRRNKRERDDK